MCYEFLSVCGIVPTLKRMADFACSVMSFFLLEIWSDRDDSHFLAKIDKGFFRRLMLIRLIQSYLNVY